MAYVSFLFSNFFFYRPEVVEGLKYTEKVDQFAFAIIIWEILLNDFSPYGKNVNVEYKVAAGLRPDISKIQIDEKFVWVVNIMKNCWERESTKRPSFEEICQTFSDFQSQNNLNLKN